MAPLLSHPPEATISTMFEVFPGLYISKIPKAIPHTITHVLNMCLDTNDLEISSTYKYKHIPIGDWDDITDQIATINAFIDSALQAEGKVLVHCFQGINRSAAAIIAYLCHREEIDSTTALRFLKEKKGDVAPTVLFLKKIDSFYGRANNKEDPLVGFHRRLQQRINSGNGKPAKPE